MSGLQLLAVAHFDGGHPALPDGVEEVAVRDLAALAVAAPFARMEPSAQDVERYRAVVEAVFREHPVLPAPLGTVFRSREQLQRWLELHYSTLSEGLAFVGERQVARVHVARRTSDPAEREEGTDLAETAAEIIRTLRRQAVAVLPLRTEHLTGIVVSSAFLVERDLWQAFAESVETERQRHPNLDVRLTGPWPAYDFVRMQLAS